MLSDSWAIAQDYIPSEITVYPGLEIFLLVSDISNSGQAQLLIVPIMWTPAGKPAPCFPVRPSPLPGSERPRIPLPLPSWPQPNMPNLPAAFPGFR